jgi:hypothetical protein
LLSPSASSSSPSSVAAASSTSPGLPWTPSRKLSSSSIISSLISSSVSSPASLPSSTNGQGLGLQYDGAEEEFVDPATPLPTFDVPPAMLAVDLSLAPGESRSCKSLLFFSLALVHHQIQNPLTNKETLSYLHKSDVYTLPLPSNLPPTYKGRVFKFSYHLVVGVCRAAPTPSLGSGYAGYGPPGAGAGKGKGGGASTSRVMRVPVRVYNSVVGELCWVLANS